MVVGLSEVEGAAGGELRGGGKLRWRSDFVAAMVPDQNQVVGKVHGRMRKFLAKRTERGRYWRCRIGRGGGGGRSCRR